MIVEPKPFLPGRTASAGPEPSLPSPARGADNRGVDNRGVDRGGDTAFGRTLTDALRADRSNRPPSERAGAEEGHSGRRVGNQDEISADRRADKRPPSDGNSGEARPPAVAERPAPAEEGRDSDDVDTVDEDAAETAGTAGAIGAAATAGMEDLASQPSRAGAAGQVAGVDPPAVEAAGVPSASTDQIAGTEPATDKTGPTTAAGGLDAAAPDTTTDAHPGGTPPDPVTGIITGTPAGAEDTTDATIAGAAGADVDVDVDVDVDIAADVAADIADDTEGIGERVNGSSSPDGPGVELAEPEDGETTTARGAGDEAPTGTAGSTMAAAVAAGGLPATTAATTAAADPSDSTTASATNVLGDVEAASATPLKQPATAGRPGAGTDADAATGDGGPSETTAESTDRSGSETTPVDIRTAERTSDLGNDRPVSGLSPSAAHRGSGPTPTRTGTVAAEASNPASELVELQTSGLAERLRPAFAAVRRGVNGLEELRLRIQDDNAGPIKVDIATVDNRVRVLLSAGNDDLMRQLGQERDRLADELRRAGFAQASIDIEAEGRGRRHESFDQDASGRPGYGVGGPASSGAAADAIDPVSSRRRRAPTGLDLDL